MKEVREIIKAYHTAQAAEKKTALATVVLVEGSSYRRAGARMLITEDGLLTGAISGGCLEGDALRKALRVIQAQKAAIVVYDTMDDDDATIGLGTGCNGIVHVLIEPIFETQAVHPIHLLQKVNEKRQPWVVMTFFNRQERAGMHQGTRYMVNEQGLTIGSCPVPQLESTLLQEAKHVLRTKTSQWTDFRLGEQTMAVFLEFIPPTPQLVIAGAGNDVIPLVQLADILGWDTIVADGRPNYAKPGRFGGGCQILVAKPERILENISLDEYTLFALMTHNYNYDKALLYELCERQVSYVAMLGPKKKINRMVEEFAAENRALTPDQQDLIYSPAGLDLGAETAEEIALSILAEMRAFLAGRKINSLRDKLTPIHSLDG